MVKSKTPLYVCKTSFFTSIHIFLLNPSNSLQRGVQKRITTQISLVTTGGLSDCIVTLFASLGGHQGPFNILATKWQGLSPLPTSWAKQQRVRILLCSVNKAPNRDLGFFPWGFSSSSHWKTLLRYRSSFLDDGLCFSSRPMSYWPSTQWSGTVPIPIFLLIFSRTRGARPKSVPSFLPGRDPPIPPLVPGALPQHLLFLALFCCKGSSLLGYIPLATSDIFDQSSNIFAYCFQASWYFHRVFWTQTPGLRL